MSTPCGRTSTMGSRKTNGIATSAAREQRFFFGGHGDDRLIPLSACVDVIVIEALADEDEVCNAKIDSQSNNGGDEISPDCTCIKSQYKHVTPCVLEMKIGTREMNQRKKSPFQLESIRVLREFRE